MSAKRVDDDFYISTHKLFPAAVSSNLEGEVRPICQVRCVGAWCYFRHMQIAMITLTLYVLLNAVCGNSKKGSLS